MPDVRFDVFTNAEETAAVYERSVSRVVAQAERMERAHLALVRSFEQPVGSGGLAPGGGSQSPLRESNRLLIEGERIAKAAAAAERERIRVQIEAGRLQQQQRQQETAAAREADAAARQAADARARIAREEARADALRTREQQAAARALRTAESTLGGEFRGQSQRIVFEQRLKQAIDAGLVSQERANTLRREADTVFSTNAVNARDLRLNMLGLNQSVQALAAGFGIAIPGANALGAALALTSKSSQAGFASLGLLSGVLGAGALAFGGMAVAAVKSASALDEIADSADAVGLSVEAFQELRFLGVEAGVKNIDAAIARFTDRLGELKSGGAALDPTLRTLGLRFDDLAKLGTVDALKLIADRTQELADPTQQAAVAVDLFGRSQIRMASVLRGGSEEIARQIQEAHELGTILDEETVRAGEHLSTEIEKLSFRFKALSINIGSLLIPKVNEAVEVFGNLARIFIDAFSTNDISESIRSLVLQQQAGIITAEELADEIAKLKAESVSLKETVESSGGLGFTKAGDEALESFAEIVRKVTDLREQVKSFRTGGEGSLSRTQARQEAERIVSGLNEADLKRQAEAVGDVTGSRLAVIALTARWIEEERRLSDQLGESKKVISDVESAEKQRADTLRREIEAADKLRERQLATQDEARVAIDEQILATQEQAEALRGEAAARALGEEALIAYQRQQAISAAVQKAENQAIAAGIPLIEERRRAIEEATGSLFDAQQIAKQQADADKAADKLMLEPFKNAIDGVQNAFTSMFEDLFDGGINSFKDFASSVLDVFKTLAAEIATLLVFKPILGGLIGGASGGGGGIGGLLGGFLGGGSGGSGVIGPLVQSALTNGQGLTGIAGDLLKTGASLVGLGGLFGGVGLSAVTGAGVSAATGAAPLIGSAAVSALSAQGVGTVGATGAGAGALGGLASSGVGLIAAQVVGMILAAISTVDTLKTYASGRNPFLQVSAGSAAGTGAAAGATFGAILGPLGISIGAVLGAIVGPILQATARKSSLRITTHPSGTTGVGAQGTTNPIEAISEGAFGAVTFDPGGTHGFGVKTLIPLARFFSKLDDTIAKVLDPEQIERVAATLQSTRAISLNFRTFDGEIFKYTVDRLNTIFKEVVSPNLAQGVIPGAKRTVEGNKVILDDIHLQEVLADIVGGFKHNLEGTQQAIDAAVKFLAERKSILDALAEINDETSGKSEALKSQEALNKQFKELKERMVEMKFSAEELASADAALIAAQAKLKEGFAQGISDQILSFTNPFELAERELERKQEERRKNAIDFGADMVEIERLSQLEREALARDAFRSIRALREEMLTGSTSSLAPLTRIANAETAFNEQLAIAQGGNLGQADQFAAAASALRDLKREFLGAPSFAEFEQFLLATIENVFGSLPGFATQGTFSNLGSDSRLIRVQPQEQALITRGAPPDPRPDIKELGRVISLSNSNLIDEVRGLRTEVAGLRRDNDELRTQNRLILSAPNRRSAA